jgi:hypothetical protein
MSQDRQKEPGRPKPAPKKKRADLFHELPAAEEEGGAEPDFRQRGLYITLGAIVLVSVVASLMFSRVPWVDRFGAELATEALGILLTLVFVQRFLERQERARRLRGSIGALRKGGRALSSIAWTWADLIRSSMRKAPPHAPASLTDLFVSHNTECLAQWDPRAEHRDGGQPTETSGSWALHRFQSAQEALNEIIIAYGGSLDPGYVEAVDELVDDPFLRIIREVAADEELDPRDWRQRLNAARAHRDAHFNRLVQAIAIHNRLATEAGQLRSRRTAPRTGTVGLKLSLDHDLRVPLTLDQKWWNRMS